MHEGSVSVEFFLELLAKQNITQSQPIAWIGFEQVIHHFVCLTLKPHSLLVPPLLFWTEKCDSTNVTPSDHDGGGGLITTNFSM